MNTQVTDDELLNSVLENQVPDIDRENKENSQRPAVLDLPDEEPVQEEIIQQPEPVEHVNPLAGLDDEDTVIPSFLRRRSNY